MAETPDKLEVKVTLNQESLEAVADLIGYGIVGTILDSAYDVLVGLDSEMALKVDSLAKECLARFEDAGNTLGSNVGLEL